jgi:ribosome-associated protein
MTVEELKERIPLNQLIFSASRSSGPGGQNVNKVSSRVEVRFCVVDSPFLNDIEKAKILSRLTGRINASGELFVTSQSERTQLMNRRKAEEKLFKLLSTALTDKPVRRATRPTIASKAVRLGDKKKRSDIKKLRRTKKQDDDE